jgi:hypothetical protein
MGQNVAILLIAMAKPMPLNPPPGREGNTDPHAAESSKNDGKTQRTESLDTGEQLSRHHQTYADSRGFATRASATARGRHKPIEARVPFPLPRWGKTRFVARAQIIWAPADSAANMLIKRGLSETNHTATH